MTISRAGYFFAEYAGRFAPTVRYPINTCATVS